MNGGEWVSGYHSDSAIQRSPARIRSARSKGSLRDMLDPATEPLIDEADSDRERTMTAEGVIDFGDDPRHPAMGIPVLPQFEDKYRSPVQFEEFFQTPRKARWNKKVTRKRSIRPATTVRKGRLAAYCVSAELTTEKFQRWLLQRKKDRGNNSYVSSQPGAPGAGGAAAIHSSLPMVPLSSVSASLVGLEWREKNYMGVVYTTNDDGKCDPLDAKHIFIFPYGAIIFWGCTKQEEEAYIEMIQDFTVEPVSKLEMEESYDDFAYLYGEHSRIWNYEVTLVSNDPEEKLALSFSLAQSAKLFVFEDRVDNFITNTKDIPMELATEGVIKLSRTEISKLTGQVFLERNSIFLQSDLLDTPEFFWEADVWEPLYKKFCSYLDIPNRIEILNKRLDILKELLEVLNTQLENNHSTKLEWIVISLIVVEVVLQVIEIFLDDIMGRGPAL